MNHYCWLKKSRNLGVKSQLKQKFKSEPNKLSVCKFQIKITYGILFTLHDMTWTINMLNLVYYTEKCKHEQILYMYHILK